MTDHPSTFKAADTHDDGVEWEDRASLHRKGDHRGVFDGAKGLRRGTLAELIRHVMLLPEEERRDYVIQKAGDRRIEPSEIESLAARPDFPHTDSGTNESGAKSV